MPMAQWEAMRPPLTPENEQAIDVWRFCGGWNPDRLPLAVAYYEIDDVDLLITQLMVINDAVETYKAAQRKR